MCPCIGRVTDDPVKLHKVTIQLASLGYSKIYNLLSLMRFKISVAARWPVSIAACIQGLTPGCVASPAKNTLPITCSAREVLAPWALIEGKVYPPLMNASSSQFTIHPPWKHADAVPEIAVWGTLAINGRSSLVKIFCGISAAADSWSPSAFSWSGKELLEFFVAHVGWFLNMSSSWDTERRKISASGSFDAAIASSPAMKPTTTNCPNGGFVFGWLNTGGYWVIHISGRKESVQTTSKRSSGQKRSENASMTCHKDWQMLHQ